MARPRKYGTEEEKYAAQLAGSQRWKERNREHTRAYSRAQYPATKEGYAKLFLKRSKHFTPDTDIDLEFLLAFDDVCHITRRPFEYVNKYSTFSNPLAPSIDRIDSSRGYYKDNVQIIFNCINKMKNDLPNDDFINLWSDLIGSRTRT